MAPLMPALACFSPLLAYATAGDAANGLLFGWDIATLQKWALIYLGASSLAFILVWVIGFFRRAS